MRGFDGENPTGRFSYDWPSLPPHLQYWAGACIHGWQCAASLGGPGEPRNAIRSGRRPGFPFRRLSSNIGWPCHAMPCRASTTLAGARPCVPIGRIGRVARQPGTESHAPICAARITDLARTRLQLRGLYLSLDAVDTTLEPASISSAGLAAAVTWPQVLSPRRFGRRSPAGAPPPHSHSDRDAGPSISVHLC
jgi:hypothetical protein